MYACHSKTSNQTQAQQQQLFFAKPPGIYSQYIDDIMHVRIADIFTYHEPKLAVNKDTRLQGGAPGSSQQSPVPPTHAHHDTFHTLPALPITHAKPNACPPSLTSAFQAAFRHLGIAPPPNELEETILAAWDRLNRADTLRHQMDAILGRAKSKRLPWEENNKCEPEAYGLVNPPTKPSPQKTPTKSDTWESHTLLGPSRKSANETEKRAALPDRREMINLYLDIIS